MKPKRKKKKVLWVTEIRSPEIANREIVVRIVIEIRKPEAPRTAEFYC